MTRSPGPRKRVRQAAKIPVLASATRKFTPYPPVNAAIWSIAVFLHMVTPRSFQVKRRDLVHSSRVKSAALPTAKRSSRKNAAEVWRNFSLASKPPSSARAGKRLFRQSHGRAAAQTAGQSEMTGASSHGTAGWISRRKRKAKSAHPSPQIHPAKAAARQELFTA